MSLKYPIEYGIITNWDDFDVLLDHTFKSQLRIDPKEFAVLMTEPALNPRANRAKLCQILFEKYEVPGFYLQNTAALTMYAAGRMTGVAVESGYVSTFSSVVYSGYVLPHTIPKTLYCGRDFDWYLLKLLHKRGYEFNSAVERTEIPKIKEKLCFVSEDFDRDLELSRNSDEFEKSYELPDGRKIYVNSERILVGEGLFNPSLMDNDFPGIHEQVNRTLQRADLDLRRFTYNNIVLSGGNTMFPGFKERLLKEMKKLAPSSLLPKVVAIPERKMAAWLGGSIMSSLSTMEQLWITPQEYEEHGPGIVQRRCF